MASLPPLLFPTVGLCPIEDVRSPWSGSAGRAGSDTGGEARAGQGRGREGRSLRQSGEQLAESLPGVVLRLPSEIPMGTRGAHPRYVHRHVEPPLRGRLQTGTPRGGDCASQEGKREVAEIGS